MRELTESAYMLSELNLPQPPHCSITTIIADQTGELADVCSVIPKAGIGRVYSESESCSSRKRAVLACFVISMIRSACYRFRR